MLSQLLFVRLKAAENALRDGRLDEAYRLATAPDIREHRRGGAVLAKLGKKLVERAREHYRADRFTEALIDLDKAEAGDVAQQEIAELREQVRTVAHEQERRAQSQRERLGQARRRVEDGSLIAGKRILDYASGHDRGSEDLRKMIEVRSDEVAVMAKQAESLIKQGQLAAAAQRVIKAKACDKNNEAVARIETKLCEQVVQHARAAMMAGRIRRAMDELDCLGNLGSALPAKREIEHMLALVRDAQACVQRNQYTEARQHLMGLIRLLPKADWLRGAIDQLRQLDELGTALGAGPLGESIAQASTPNAGQGPSPGRTAKAPSLDDTVALPAIGHGSGSLPNRLLLLVDGGGSYLLLRSAQATVGRAASSDPADVALYSDVAQRHANISRVDDDYFVFGTKGLEVGGHRTRHQLLRDGDRIVLGKKAKMTFRLPSRKSPSAVLDLSDTTKMPNDVRRVVLFQHHVTMGSGLTAHIKCQTAGGSLVLFERDGDLWVRQHNNGHVDTTAVRLRLGEQVEVAGASFVLRRWPSATAGSARVS